MTATCERVDVRGARHYRTPDGTFPSVTTILKATKDGEDAAALEAWKARVGEEAAKLASSEATKRGDRLHKKAEAWLRARGWECPEESWGVGRGDPWWDSLLPFLRAVVGVRAVEAYVWHAGVRYAGALDAVVVTRRGKVLLVDWKTSGRPFLSSDALRDYRCQGAAYLHAARERGLQADDVAVVVAHSSGPCEVVDLPRVHVDGAWSWFRRRAEAFHAAAA